MSTFVAIDFETADYGADSACAVGLVRVENQAIVDQAHYFIQPPRPDFRFTHIHGITWDDVAEAPTFDDVWPRVSEFIDGVDFLVAHNAKFDQKVLQESLTLYGITPPAQDFQCTVKLARRVLQIFPTNLAEVSRRLSIPLNHHEALSDALACAKIMIEVQKAEAENPIV